LSQTATKPVIGLAMGDPAGISPELTARVVSLPEAREAANLIVVGDMRVLQQGAAVAGVTLDLDHRRSLADLTVCGRPLFIDLGHLDPATVQTGVASRAGGAFALQNFNTCLELAGASQIEAVTFTPFNKTAMRLAHPSYEDEIVYTAELLGLTSPASEFNILEGLWNARVTSHVPLAAVPSLLTREGIVRAIRLTHASLVEAGFNPARIAVAALNPHAGDNGNFGREEIDIIAPAVAQAKADGIVCDGPFPSDTVFLRARGGAFDAVLTMYHDQGQIAIKLIGFDRGVTLLGGFPFPICTAAHGTAYDIAGQGRANVGAMREAVKLAARMAQRKRAQKRSAA
jgi:4-hydroxythreonine-4-phosphate dehydrogenase